MQLLVRVIEARDIPPTDPIGSIDPYLGKQRFETKVVNKCLNPSWCEEFSFQIDDLNKELYISVLDKGKCFYNNIVGRIKVPISRVFDAPDKSLGTAWYTLQPKNKKAKNKYCGEILLTISFSQSNLLVDLQSVDDNVSLSRKRADIATESPSRFANGLVRLSSAPSTDERSRPQTLVGRIDQMFNKIGDIPSAATNEVPDVLEPPESAYPAAEEDKSDEQPSSSKFEEVIRTMEMRDQGGDIPSNLPGGVVLDRLYAISPHELNSLLFSSDSNFFKSVTDMQGSKELQVGSWKFENGGEHLKRVVTYNKTANIIKDMKAIEDQIYLKADGKTFAVLSTVKIPDAMYGRIFRTEVLYCITSGPELPSGELSSRLVVSWCIKFLQSTMMKGMIENGARQLIKESFDVYGNLLSQNVKPVDVKDISSEEQVLAPLKVEQQSDWKLADQYFATFRGLEFVGLDLPDSIGELVISGILVLQGKRVLDVMPRFMQAWLQKGSDHGTKAQGDVWLLNVALIEGSNLAAVDSSGFSDPYVVFTCNGKTRRSSIKFQKSDPLWNEIFEFDAMDEPPSVLNVEVFDFDGPFNEAKSLGHTEINILKTNISDTSDVWAPLQGELAQAWQSKLHLRISMNNTRVSSVAEDYISKVKEEVQEKITLQSPQSNSVFQKLFGLPPKEFLINDFTCRLKRKRPLQGRLFLSARIIGFNGLKTKFFFLWEDIEDIQVVAPTLSSMGTPSVSMTLKPGRGFDARHGAKTQDEKGRLKFHFHTFVSFNVAHRTIMALWNATALSPEQKVQIVEEESDTENLQVSEEDFIAKYLQEDSESKSLLSEESGPFLGVQDASMSIIYSSVHSIPTSFFMELFGSNDLDCKVMERTGCLNYSHSPWESEKPDVYQRRLYYKFNKHISHYRGKVTSIQKKSCLYERNGWLVEEVMTFHGVPLGDYFNVHLRYQVERVSSRSMGCSVQVYSGIAWLKNIGHKERITKNILLTLQERLLVIFTELEKEFVARK